ncbi:MAG TPA: hypothetical protein EYM84_07850 [Flavobacteriales bacterium]|nr:hypothetical protein [Flavobacteriales bacterium]
MAKKGMDQRLMIFQELKNILGEYAGILVESGNNENTYHLHGTIPAKVGKTEYDGIYFASAVIRTKFVALHFFPIYTHVKLFDKIEPDLRKCLKGKSCFHIKKNDENLYNEIRNLLDLGVKVYQKEGWI